MIRDRTSEEIELKGHIPIRESKNTHPKCLLKNSECFSCPLSLHCYLFRFLQHLFKQIFSVLER
uniref:Uncharacterized protein n=1 Tax=Rhizophora mucronata TaxID=61149 RepID=A0A2P2MPU2_RHIMU